MNPVGLHNTLKGLVGDEGDQAEAQDPGPEGEVIKNRR